MKYILLPFFFILFSCNTKPEKVSGTAEQTDSTSFNSTLISNKAAVYSAFGTKHETCDIRAEEIKTAEAIMAEMVRIDQRIHMEKYTRQYVPAMNEKGEKCVWINCFCSDIASFPAWKTEIVMVDDGGACFFNLKINLVKKKCYDFMVNGEG